MSAVAPLADRQPSARIRPKLTSEIISSCCIRRGDPVTFVQLPGVAHGDTRQAIGDAGAGMDDSAVRGRAGDFYLRLAAPHTGSTSGRPSRELGS